MRGKLLHVKLLMPLPRLPGVGGRQPDGALSHVHQLCAGGDGLLALWSEDAGDNGNQGFEVCGGSIRVTGPTAPHGGAHAYARGEGVFRSRGGHRGGNEPGKGGRGRGGVSAQALEHGEVVPRLEQGRVGPGQRSFLLAHEAAEVGDGAGNIARSGAAARDRVVFRRLG
ncbi:hypothetical protein [Streptomyces sp. ME109]|uniref:hypothetical protein n=1 Tax=Streptomyces sp. me109 TaxID=1827853 RepID=UPI0016511C6F|nr:hypothetical protein [Streptomyces sp. me109]